MLRHNGIWPLDHVKLRIGKRMRGTAGAPQGSLPWNIEPRENAATTHGTCSQCVQVSSSSIISQNSDRCLVSSFSAEVRFTAKVDKLHLLSIAPVSRIASTARSFFRFNIQWMHEMSLLAEVYAPPPCKTSSLPARRGSSHTSPSFLEQAI